MFPKVLQDNTNKTNRTIYDYWPQDYHFKVSYMESISMKWHLHAMRRIMKNNTTIPNLRNVAKSVSKYPNIVWLLLTKTLVEQKGA